MQNVLKITKKRWESYPESRKGRITNTWPEEGLLKHWEGRRTLRAGNARLVEGIDFIVEG